MVDGIVDFDESALTGDLDPAPEVPHGENTLNKVDVRQLALDKLVPNAWNPNAMDDKAFNRLTEELSTTGMIDPIQVIDMQDGLFRIIGGEHRYHAARMLGWDSIPCVVLSGPKWLDEDMQKLVTVRLNALRGKIDPTKMVKLYEEMSNKYGEEEVQRLFAYTDKGAWDSLVKDIGKGLVKSGLPKNMADKFDQAAKEVKTVDDLSRVLNELFSRYGSTLPQNFMVLTWGGREHIYIVLNKSMKASMDKVVKYCQVTGRDISEVLAPLTAVFAKHLGSDDSPVPDSPFDDGTLEDFEITSDSTEPDVDSDNASPDEP